MDNEGTTSLFGDVKFVIAQCNHTEEIKTILIGGGAKHINYLSEHVTLVIADENCPEAEEAVELYDKPVVSSLWVYLSSRANRLLPTEAFSPMKTIFNKVVASFSNNLSKRDTDILASTLTFYGAKLSKEIHRATHYIVASADDCETLADKEALTPNHKVVAPDWVLDSLKQKSCCDEQLYSPNLLIPKPATPPPPPAPPPPPPAQIQPQQKPTSPKLVPPTPQQTLRTPSPKSQNKTPERKSSSNTAVSQIKILTGNSHNNNLPPRLNFASNHQRVQGPQQQIRPQHQNDQQMPNSQHMPNQQQYYQKQYPQQNYPSNPQQSPAVQQPTSLSNHVVQTGPMQATNVRHVQYRPNFSNASSTPNQVVPVRNVFYNQQQMRPGPPHIQQHQDSMQNQQQYVQQQPVMQQQQQQQQYYQRPQQNFISTGSQSQINHMQQQPPTQQTHMVQGGPVQNISNIPQYQNNLVGPVPRQMNVRGPRPFYGQPQKQASPSLHPQDSMQNNQQYHHNPQQPPLMQNQLPMQRHPVQQQQQHQQQQPPQQQLQQQQYYQRPYSQQNFSQPPLSNQAPGQQLGHQTNHNMQQNPMRPQFQPNLATSVPGSQPVRVSRNLYYNQNQESRPQMNVRVVSPPKVPNYQIPVPRMQNNNLSSGNPNQLQIHVQSQQPQPHPSIFDDRQESNLAQIKAKVPIVIEDVEYFGHDPKENVPKDLPLFGCRFKFVEYDEVNAIKKEKWIEIIKAAGGTFEDDLEKTTHLICESRLTDLYDRASKRDIRCITIYWINDVLAQNRLSYPWKALHFPLPYSKSKKPLTHNHLVTLTNFRGRERREVIDMIGLAGARYTDSFSTHNTLIICGNVGGDKYEHAVEWKTPIVNCQFINDILLTGQKDLNVMLALSKYQLFSPSDQLKLKTYSEVKELMKPWTKPISVGDCRPLANGDSPSKITPVTSSSEDSGIVTTNNNSTITEIINNSGEYRKRKSNEPVRLLFTHLNSSLVDRLKTQALELGLGFASSPINCTHLIVDRISRTPKFVCAFSHAKYILNYSWIIESHKAKEILDEKQFILQDKVGEEKYLFNLVYSWLKRDKYKGLLFSNLIFFVTPSVISDVSNVKEMIESAGGVVSTKKLPSKMQMDQMKLDGKKFVVVSCEKDLHLCSSLEQYGVDIVDVEFVICGILRQDIDYNAHRIKTPFIQPAKRLKDH